MIWRRGRSSVNDSFLALPHGSSEFWFQIFRLPEQRFRRCFRKGPVPSELELVLEFSPTLPRLGVFGMTYAFITNP